MRLLGHTLSSDASIHLGGLVVEGIPASDLITHAVPPRAARVHTKTFTLLGGNASKHRSCLYAQSLYALAKAKKMKGPAAI